MKLEKNVITDLSFWEANRIPEEFKNACHL